MTLNRCCFYLRAFSGLPIWLPMCGLLLFASPAPAEDSLPEIGWSNTATEHDTPEITQQFKALEGWVKHYTTYSLTDDSELQLKTDGFQIETNYQHGIVTEFEAKEGGEVSFKIKIPF